MHNCPRLKDIEGGIYDVEWRFMDSIDHKLPQTRKRLYVVALKRSAVKAKFEWPCTLPKVKARSFLDKPVKEAPAQLPSSDNGCRKLFTALSKIEASGEDWRKEDYMIDIDASPRFGVSIKKGHCGCLTRTRSGNGGFFITSRLRKMTLRELHRFQGFPAVLKHSSATPRQLRLALGNAWSVNVAARVLYAIVVALTLSTSVVDPFV